MRHLLGEQHRLLDRIGFQTPPETAAAWSALAHRIGRGLRFGLMDAPNAPPMLRDPARAHLKPKAPPIGRYIQPEEVAALACFLLGPMAGAITGQQIMICGGASL